MPNNIIFSKAEKIHIPQLIELWKEAFGDSNEYINFFMNHCFERCKVIMAQQGNKIVGALYLISVSTSEYGEDKNGYYLYALAVEENSRNSGIGKSLVKNVCELAKAENSFIVLCPADLGLADYYKKLGFIENCFLNELVFDSSGNDSNVNFDELDAKTFQKLRNISFKNIILWDCDSLKYILEENQYIGGFNYKIILEDKTYFVLGRKQEDYISITETNLPENLMYKIDGWLKKLHDSKQILWRIPAESGCNALLTGMTYNLAKDNFYFNHTLN